MSVTPGAVSSGRLLDVRSLDVAYDRNQVLFGVDFHVDHDEIVAVLGTNGAGKSTLLRAVAGLLRPSAGVVEFEGADITGESPARIAGRGLCSVPGEKSIFPTLTVAENLRLAGWLYRHDRAHLDAALEEVVEQFPVLRARWGTAGGSLSGGEQQMLSLAEAFLARPKLLMIDELSLGLAPTVVEMLVGVLPRIHARGTAIVLVEQSVNTALRIAQRAVFVEKGEIQFSGSTRELMGREDLLRSMFLHSASDEAVRSRGAPASQEAQAPAPKAVLRVSDLVKRYGGIRALDGVTFTLRQGEILGLIGPNGAGKTTIFDLITGNQSIDGGTVVLRGNDVTDWPAFRRARLGMARSFQSARLWPSLTVRDALLCSMDRHVRAGGVLPSFFRSPAVRASEQRLRRAVDRALHQLGLWVYRDQFVGDLSTGVRRMVEIAGLMACEPKVLLLDEPSSGIAQRETEALGPILGAVRERLGCAMLLIEHDMPLLTSLSDRIVALDSGAVVTEGTAAEVLSHPEVVRSYLGGVPA